MKDIDKRLTQQMERSLDFLKGELASLRTGRAHPSLLDRIVINYYGTDTPLSQLSSISAPEARMLMITPYDKNAIGMIEKAILSSDLSINPNNDGKVIRLNLPMLTEENRRELTKVAKRMGEEAKIAVRNSRRSANDEIKKAQKDAEITEDDVKLYEKDVQNITDEFIERIDKMVEEKMDDIMEV